MFEIGDKVRVNDFWWAQNCRPGQSRDGPNKRNHDPDQREFTVKSLFQAGRRGVELDGIMGIWIEEAFDNMDNGPW